MKSLFMKSFDISHRDYPGEGKALGGGSGCPCLQGGYKAVRLCREVEAEQEAMAMPWMVTESFPLW